MTIWSHYRWIGKDVRDVCWTLLEIPYSRYVCDGNYQHRYREVWTDCFTQLFLETVLFPLMTLHESIKLARQCSHGVYVSLKRDTKALYISSVVTDGMFNETRWRTTTSFFFSQKNVTRAVRIFCNISLVALSIFKEEYVSLRLDASFSSVHLANPILILYDAVVLDNLVRFKALQSFDNSFAISVISPARANERFFSAQYERTTAS